MKGRAFLEKAEGVQCGAAFVLPFDVVITAFSSSAFPRLQGGTYAQIRFF